MQLNLKHVARLVAIALGIAFTALTIFYCIGIMPDFTHNLNGLLHDGYAYESASNYIFYIVGQFIVPILLLVAAVLAIHRAYLLRKRACFRKRTDFCNILPCIKRVLA